MTYCSTSVTSIYNDLLLHSTEHLDELLKIITCSKQWKGALSSQYFEVQGGGRQGDPLSPYLFIIAADILAIAIQTNTDIKGLKITEEEFKLLQYAHDLTVFVPNVECA